MGLPKRTYEQHMDAEANAFAMELLMPESFLRRDVKAIGGIDLSDDGKVAELAKKYRVSAPMMALRLGQIFLNEDVR